MDHAWFLPGNYLKGAKDRSTHSYWFRKGWPGVNSFFEAKLTAIPVATNTPATQKIGAGSSGSAATSNSDNQTFITSQKTANVNTGIYMPFLLARWLFTHNRYAAGLGPVARLSLNTLTGPSTQTVPLPNGNGTSTQSFESVYNSYEFGIRSLTYKLTSSKNRQPELESYFDVSLGRDSNLGSYIGAPVPKGGSPSTYTGSVCGNYFPTVSSTIQAVDFSKRLWRIHIQGVMEIPKTVAFVGFSANVGQRTFGADKLDTAFQPADDIRFVFGAKTDVATILKKFGAGNGN